MNEATQLRTRSKWRWIRVVFNGLICIAVLSAAVAVVVWINLTEPVAEKIDTTRKSAALVETIIVQRGTYSPRLVVLGTVQAAQEIRLRPRVDGQVVELSPEFTPGGMIKKGDLLLSLDPADFENALSIRASELEQAEASMEIEKARQRLAEKELKLLEGSIDETSRSLVMREPQLASIQAEVSAAKAAVDRAKLDLARTKVYAPFDAQVLTRLVNIGSQVGPGDELGQLVGLEEFWIMAAVPVRSLRWIQFPSDEYSESPGHGDPMDPPQEPLATSARIALNAAESRGEATAESDRATQDDGVDRSHSMKGSKVILRDPDAWGPEIDRKARVSRLIGTLDQQTRLARVLITIQDPLGQKSNVPPLILNTLLETEILGRPIDNVIRLDRQYVRDQDTVWVMKNDKLEIRETEIVVRDARYAYIRTGLDAGDEVVTTTLATVAEGVGLRRIKDTPPEDNSQSKEPSGEEVSK